MAWRGAARRPRRVPFSLRSFQPLRCHRAPLSPHRSGLLSVICALWPSWPRCWPRWLCGALTVASQRQAAALLLALRRLLTAASLLLPRCSWSCRLSAASSATRHVAHVGRGPRSGVAWRGAEWRGVAAREGNEIKSRASLTRWAGGEATGSRGEGPNGTRPLKDRALGRRARRGIKIILLSKFFHGRHSMSCQAGPCHPPRRCTSPYVRARTHFFAPIAQRKCVQRAAGRLSLD